MPGKYCFDEITNLHIFDLKAQKKTTACKRLFDIPLTPQEQIQITYARTHPEPEVLSLPSPKLTLPKHLTRLAAPKTAVAMLGPIQKIVTKCERLQSQLQVKKKSLKRISRGKNRDFDYLVEMSEVTSWR